MNLEGYCYHTAERLIKEKIIIYLDLDEKAKKILAVINIHHVSHNVLRVFSVIFLYKINFATGPTLEEILSVLENKQLENKTEIHIGISRLLGGGIIKEVKVEGGGSKEEKRFLLTEAFLSKLDFMKN